MPAEVWRPPWSQIVVHHTASADQLELDTDEIRAYHLERGWRDIGYHFVCELIGDDYVVIAGRPLSIEGAHEPRANRTGIGFAFVGNLEVTKLPPEQLEVAAAFLGGLCAAFGIPVGEIRGHRDFKPTACPGKNLDLGLLRQRVQHHLVAEGWRAPTRGGH